MLMELASRVCWPAHGSALGQGADLVPVVGVRGVEPGAVLSRWRPGVGLETIHQGTVLVVTLVVFGLEVKRRRPLADGGGIVAPAGQGEREEEGCGEAPHEGCSRGVRLSPTGSPDIRGQDQTSGPPRRPCGGTGAGTDCVAHTNSRSAAVVDRSPAPPPRRRRSGLGQPSPSPGSAGARRHLAPGLRAARNP
jgi:hypothetical protein